MKLKFFELSVYSISNIFNMISSDNVSIHHVTLINWVLGITRQSSMLGCIHHSICMPYISALFQKYSLESLYRYYWNCAYNWFFDQWWDWVKALQELPGNFIMRNCCRVNCNILNLIMRLSNLLPSHWQPMYWKVVWSIVIVCCIILWWFVMVHVTTDRDFDGVGTNRKYEWNTQ